MKLFKTLLFVLFLNSVGFMTTYGQEMTVEDETSISMLGASAETEEEEMENEYD